MVANRNGATCVVFWLKFHMLAVRSSPGRAPIAPLVAAAGAAGAWWWSGALPALTSTLAQEVAGLALAEVREQRKRVHQHQDWVLLLTQRVVNGAVAALGVLLDAGLQRFVLRGHRRARGPSAGGGGELGEGGEGLRGAGGEGLHRGGGEGLRGAGGVGLLAGGAPMAGAVGAAAVVAVPAPPVVGGGSFVLLRRGGECDEVLLVARVPGSEAWVARTTDVEGANFVWVAVKLNLGQFALPVMDGAGSRVEPMGLGVGANWVCVPPLAAAQWTPTAAEMGALMAEGTFVAEVLGRDLDENKIFEAGSAGPMVDLIRARTTPPAPALPAAPPVVPPAIGAGVGSALAVPAAGGGAAASTALGPGPVPGAGAGSLDLSTMMGAIQELKSLMGQEKDPKRSGSRSKKKKKKKRKGSRKRKKKKGSSSGSSRSRSSSSSSGSSSSGPLRWRENGKNRKVRAKELTRLDGEKFKKTGDVIAYAESHPGALGAFFLAAIYQRMTKGLLTESKQLRDVNCSQWAAAHSGLQEMRDLREVQTLCMILDILNRRQLSKAIDALSQRVLAIQQAKRKDGKWEKAEMLELLPPTGTSLVPAGMRSLLG